MMDELGPLYQRVESGSLIRRVRFTEVALAMPPPDPTPTLTIGGVEWVLVRVADARQQRALRATAPQGTGGKAALFVEAATPEEWARAKSYRLTPTSSQLVLYAADAAAADRWADALRDHSRRGDAAP